jgi:hypothetical protein
MCRKTWGSALTEHDTPMKSVRVLATILAVFLACGPLLAQGDTGRILGDVTDQSGGNVAGASVIITDVQRSVSRNLVTDADGAYVAPSLSPGTYRIRVEFKGFKTFERQNILLEVGKDLRIDAVLQPGAASETVTITEEAPMVDATSTTLGGTISNEIINDLPLNGRNYQNLLDLRPGVMVYPGGGPWTQSTNGVRPEDSSFIVDGLGNDEAFMGLSVTNAAAVAGDAATLLPIDAIQEFNVQENPKAEYGWKPGAITSVGLKSGTNDLHGTAYAFGRSDSFDARNYFNPVGQAKTPVELKQFGTTAGGHIVRDKLFYFGGYEGQRYTVGNSFTVNSPTTASVTAGGGSGCAILTTGNCKISIADASADLAAKGVPVSALSQYLLQFYPANSSQSPSVSNGFPNTNSSDNALGKIDYHMSDRNALSGSYFFGNDTLVAEDAPELQAQFQTHVHSRAQAAAGHWAWTPNSIWVNELRVGYTRYTLSIVPANASTTYSINTGVTNPVLGGLPNIRVNGLSELGGFHNFPKIVGPDNVYDFIDQVSHLVGKHAFKFGGELRDDRVHQGTFRDGRGRIQFPSLEDFLAGTPSKASLLAGSPVRDLNQWLYAGFAQDDWRITRKVTLNLGVRYEYSAPPTESHNLIGNWEPGVGLEQVGKNIGSIYKGDHKNFSPRLGLAWDVRGDGRTVVRAGYSLIYDLLSMASFLSEQNTNNTVTLGVGVVPTGASIVVGGVPSPGIGNIVATGLTLNASQLNWNGSSVGGAPIYPANTTSLVQCADTQPCDIFAMDRNYSTPFVQNFTLGIQHAISHSLSLDVAYVGNHGSKLSGIRDVNQPDLTTAVRPFNATFPYLGFINFYSNLYRSNYNGLQATVTGRNYHGVSFVLGYTYSHALDQMSYNWNQYLPQNSLNPGAEYGNSDFDIKHRFTFSLTYAIPGKKMRGQHLEGWQVNSIITLQSGQPWQSYDSADNISGTGENADRWDFFGSPSDFKSGGANPIPFIAQSNFAVDGTGNVTGVASGAPAAAASCLAAESTQAGKNQLGTFGCYASGKSVMVPPAAGTFGNMGRNIFRDTGFHNVDLSISKNFKFKERVTAQFRAEFFNFFNHPEFANPWGGTSGYGNGATADPSAPGLFGCGCATPDVASANPVLGSGSARAIQLGLKFIF